MAPAWDEKALTGLRTDLQAWFTANKRDLPWRGRDSLYAIWISEIMLQQTVVNAVIPYYRQFMARFPDVESLARADLEEVLELWSGLGYYRRARLLHRAARLVTSELGGELPRTRDQWLGLPGVGDYAAGAIASLGLSECVPAVDANARRVLARWLCADAACVAAMTPGRLAGLAAEAVDPRAPGDWNEAVMELGALVCRADNPRCGECPVRRWCRSGRAGTAAAVGGAAPRPPTMPVVLAHLVVTWRGRVLLAPPGEAPVAAVAADDQAVRDDFTGLHPGLFGLPTSAWLEPGADLDPERLWRPFLKAGGVRTSWGALSTAGTCRHAITRYRLKIQVHTLPLPASAPDRRFAWPAGWRFHPWPLDGLPVSRQAGKVLASVLGS